MAHGWLQAATFTGMTKNKLLGTNADSACKVFVASLSINATTQTLGSQNAASTRFEILPSELVIRHTVQAPDRLKSLAYAQDQEEAIECSIPFKAIKSLECTQSPEGVFNIVVGLAQPALQFGDSAGVGSDEPQLPTATTKSVGHAVVEPSCLQFLCDTSAGSSNSSIVPCVPQTVKLELHGEADWLAFSALAADACATFSKIAFTPARCAPGSERPVQGTGSQTQPGSGYCSASSVASEAQSIRSSSSHAAADSQTVRVSVASFALQRSQQVARTQDSEPSFGVSLALDGSALAQKAPQTQLSPNVDERAAGPLAAEGVAKQATESASSEQQKRVSTAAFPLGAQQQTALVTSQQQKPATCKTDKPERATTTKSVVARRQQTQTAKIAGASRATAALVEPEQPQGAKKPVQNPISRRGMSSIRNRMSQRARGVAGALHVTLTTQQAAAAPLQAAVPKQQHQQSKPAQLSVRKSFDEPINAADNLNNLAAEAAVQVRGRAGSRKIKSAIEANKQRRQAAKRPRRPRDLKAVDISDKTLESCTKRPARQAARGVAQVIPSATPRSTASGTPSQSPSSVSDSPSLSEAASSASIATQSPTLPVSHQATAEHTNSTPDRESTKASTTNAAASNPFDEIWSKFSTPMTKTSEAIRSPRTADEPGVCSDTPAAGAAGAASPVARILQLEPQLLNLNTSKDSEALSDPDADDEHEMARVALLMSQLAAKKAAKAAGASFQLAAQRARQQAAKKFASEVQAKLSGLMERHQNALEACQKAAANAQRISRRLREAQQSASPASKHRSVQQLKRMVTQTKTSLDRFSKFHSEMLQKSKLLVQQRHKVKERALKAKLKLRASIRKEIERCEV